MERGKLNLLGPETSKLVPTTALGPELQCLIPVTPDTDIITLI